MIFMITLYVVHVLVHTHVVIMQDMSWHIGHIMLVHPEIPNQVG
jgi:hypothetical protein